MAPQPMMPSVFFMSAFLGAFEGEKGGKRPFFFALSVSGGAVKKKGRRR